MRIGAQLPTVRPGIGTEAQDQPTPAKKNFVMGLILGCLSGYW